MGQLDRWNGAVVFQEAGNPLISLGLFIVPDSCICRADPSLRAYGCCFLDDTGGTADCATAQVNQVPVVGHAILAGVLAHGSDKNTIVELQFTQLQLGKQKGLHVRLPQVNSLCEEPASVGACANAGAIGVDSKDYEGRWFVLNTGFELDHHQGELPSSRTRPKDAVLMMAWAKIAGHRVCQRSVRQDRTMPIRVVCSVPTQPW